MSLLSKRTLIQTLNFRPGRLQTWNRCGSNLVTDAPSVNKASDRFILGQVALEMEDFEKASLCFESALKQNNSSIAALYGLASSLQRHQQFVQAMEVYQRLFRLLQSLNSSNELKGEVWASIGHCALLLDDLARAFSAFQQALHYLGSPKDASIWFSIGILYDRYGADDLAREAYLITLQHEKALRSSPGVPTMREREIYFRIGLIYMNLKNWNCSQECLEYASLYPPAGITSNDARFYVGVLHSLQGRIDQGRVVFEKIVSESDSRTPQSIRYKARCILSWYDALCGGVESTPRVLANFSSYIDEDPAGDGFGWYCIGRINMLAKDFSKAYEAYQQAVYRTGTNASYWNSIGILYHEIGQYRDALDAYSRSIHLAPFVADTWWNLGVLYETSHHQTEDGIDAYNRSAELDPSCDRVKERLAILRSADKKEKLPPPRPVEYCPMPFFSRPVVLGSIGQPPQRPLHMHIPSSNGSQISVNHAGSSTLHASLGHQIPVVTGERQQNHQQKLPPHQQFPPQAQNQQPISFSRMANSNQPFALPQPPTTFSHAPAPNGRHLQHPNHPMPPQPHPMNSYQPHMTYPQNGHMTHVPAQSGPINPPASMQKYMPVHPPYPNQQFARPPPRR